VTASIPNPGKFSCPGLGLALPGKTPAATASRPCSPVALRPFQRMRWGMNELTSRGHETAGNPVGEGKPGRAEAFCANDRDVGRSCCPWPFLYVIKLHHAPVIGLWMFWSDLADRESRKKPRIDGDHDRMASPNDQGRRARAQPLRCPVASLTSPGPTYNQCHFSRSENPVPKAKRNRNSSPVRSGESSPLRVL